MSPKKASSRTRKSRSKNSPQQATNGGFNIGRVHVYLRGKVWYLRYHEHGKRIQKRIGPDITQAQQLTAEVNAQLECTLPSVLGFEQITLLDLRKKWLAFHEDIKRSSLATISRYRASTTHLVEFYSHANLEYPADLTNSRVEEFVRFLRNRHVAPNGHKNAKKRPLRDAGVKYILQCSSNLLNYATTTITSTTRTEFLTDTDNHTGYSQVLQEIEYDGSTEIKRTIYTLGHDQISQTVIDTNGEETHQFGYDGHGSVRVLIDFVAAAVEASGIDQTFHFDAYGNLIGFATGQTPMTSYLYSGEAFDHNIGQQYLRARWYDAQTGRFNRLDPFFGNLNDPQSLHKYLYTHADPVNGIDPSGLFSITGFFKSTFAFISLSTAAGAGTFGYLTGEPIRGGLVGLQFGVGWSLARNKVNATLVGLGAVALEAISRAIKIGIRRTDGPFWSNEFQADMLQAFSDGVFDYAIDEALSTARVGRNGGTFRLSDFANGNGANAWFSVIHPLYVLIRNVYISANENGGPPLNTKQQVIAVVDALWTFVTNKSGANYDFAKVFKYSAWRRRIVDIVEHCKRSRPRLAFCH